MAAAMALCSSIARVFLPADSIETANAESFNFFRAYPVDRAFGIRNAAGAAAPVASGAQTGAATLTGLTIKAIYAEKDKSGFIVLNDGGSLIFVSVGESIRGYTLTEVEARRAIFSLGGIIYELRMEEKALEVRTTQVGEAQAPQTKRVVTRDEIRRYMEEPSMIWNNIGITPVSENGKFKEFLVTFVAPNSVFSELGLRAGDTLKSVNGVELDSYAAAMKLYSDIGTIEFLRLIIVRNSQTRELSYEIR
jgi:type II secretion system protein C